MLLTVNISPLHDFKYSCNSAERICEMQHWTVWTLDTFQCIHFCIICKREVLHYTADNSFLGESAPLPIFIFYIQLILLAGWSLTVRTVRVIFFSLRCNVSYFLISHLLCQWSWPDRFSQSSWKTHMPSSLIIIRPCTQTNSSYY